MKAAYGDGQEKKKVLLMGRAGAGKTSMRSIIFANYLARETRRLTATNNIEHSHLRFLGNLVLSLWDCGGQDTFMENYFESQREHIFRNAEVLIYVLEARVGRGESGHRGDSPTPVEKDLQYFRKTCESTRRFSPNAKIFVLLHKVDLIASADKETIYGMYRTEVEKESEGLQTKLFFTTIWDETLFRAWSEMVCSLVPNVRQLENHLARFCEVTHADEAVLFEKSTFLVVSHATRREHLDQHRFEKISNICKQFNLTCGKTDGMCRFSSLTIQNPNFTAFIEMFTQNTYLMLVVTDKSIQVAATLCNIDYAREHFQRIAEQMEVGAAL